MNNVGLNINVNIKIKVRIRVLYDVIEHLCRAFNFPDDMYSTLYKGIVDRQILKSVYAYYLDDNDKAVGIVKFNIDWEKHYMYASTDTGKEIEIRTDIPLIEQFANWSKDIIFYVEKMQKELNVKKLDVYYRYIDEIKNDPIKNKEANDFLGLKDSTKKIEFADEKSGKFARNKIGRAHV